MPMIRTIEGEGPSIKSPIDNYPLLLSALGRLPSFFAGQPEIDGQEMSSMENYNPKRFKRWQAVLLKKTSLDTVLIDPLINKFLSSKLKILFHNVSGKDGNAKLPTLTDLVRMNDKRLIEILGGPKAEHAQKELRLIRLLMLHQGIVSPNSKIVREIDLLGLPDNINQWLIHANLTTIKSLCRYFKEGSNTISPPMRDLVKSRLSNFIDWLNKSAERNFADEGRKNLDRRKKEAKPPGEIGRITNKKQKVLEEFGLHDAGGKLTETLAELLRRLIIDGKNKRITVAGMFGITPRTLRHWMEEENLKLPRVSTERGSKTAEEKLEGRKKQILTTFPIELGLSMPEDVAELLRQKVDGGLTNKQIFLWLEEQGVGIPSQAMVAAWLRIFNIRRGGGPPQRRKTG